MIQTLNIKQQDKHKHNTPIIHNLTHTHTFFFNEYKLK